MIPAAPTSKSDDASELRSGEKLVVLFDGECVLCNGWARFLSERDSKNQFALGTLQSPAGQRLLGERRVPMDMSSIVLITPRAVLSKSDAVLHILGHVSAPWPAATVFRIVPKFIRDPIYDFISAHRYRWFGKEESCSLATPEMRARLLPDG